MNHHPDLTGADDLDALLAPRSIALIGVSEDFNKLNGRAMKFLLEKGYGGRIYPVNPKYSEVGGHRCYADVGDIAEDVDLAIFSVAASRVLDEFDKLGAAGIAAAVVFSSGFGEMGEAGRALEQRLVEAARAHGIRLCGPNTLGLINAFDKVYATFTQYAMGETRPGPVGFVTQSGAFGTAIAALARQRGMGLGYFINTGNEADVTFSEVMSRVLADGRISVAAGYIEGLKDGVRFTRVARAALEIGKPLVVTKVGRTASGARAAASHTGSLAGEDTVFDHVMGQFGVCRARNEEHMLDVVEMFASTPLPQGRGVAIVTQSGGAGVLMSDRAEELGLEVPALASATVERLRGVLPAFGATGNPIDVTAQFIADPTILSETVKIVLSDPGIHAAAIWLQLMDQFVEPLSEIFRELKETVDKPFVVAWVAAPAAGLKALRDLGICVLRGGEPAIDGLAALCRYREARQAWQADGAARGGLALPHVMLPEGTGGVVATLEAAGCLAQAGVLLAKTSLCASASQAVEAAQRFGYPVVMKIESPDIVHKTEAHGVEVGVSSPDEVREVFARLLDNARGHKVGARLSGVLVQEMCQGTTELVIGLRQDPVFGMIVMVGLGGILVEVHKDVVFHRAPVSDTQALAMLSRLRNARLLDGVRNRPAVDRAKVAHMVSAVSAFGAAAEGQLAELDLNPVLAGPDGAVAVDWVMVRA